VFQNTLEKNFVGALGDLGAVIVRVIILVLVLMHGLLFPRHVSLVKLLVELRISLLCILSFYIITESN
jgi:hypothetical protein